APDRCVGRRRGTDPLRRRRRRQDAVRRGERGSRRAPAGAAVSVPVSAHVTGFWARATAISLGLLALTALVLIRGDRGALRPLRVAPPDGATGVSVRPVIQVEYPHALDPDAARTAFRLEPPVDGALNVVGRQLSFT